MIAASLEQQSHKVRRQVQNAERNLVAAPGDNYTPARGYIAVLSEWGRRASEKAQIGLVNERRRVL